MKYKNYAIHLGPYTWPVRWEMPGDRDLELMKAYGYTDAETRIVRLIKDKDLARLLDTKLHEYLHVIDFTYNLEIPHWAVHVIATSLAQILHNRVDVERI